MREGQNALSSPLRLGLAPEARPYLPSQAAPALLTAPRPLPTLPQHALPARPVRAHSPRCGPPRPSRFASRQERCPGKGAAARVKPFRVRPPAPARTPPHPGRRRPHVVGAAGHSARPPAVGRGCHGLPRDGDTHGGRHLPEDLTGVPWARGALSSYSPRPHNILRQ